MDKQMNKRLFVRFHPSVPFRAVSHSSSNMPVQISSSGMCYNVGFTRKAKKVSEAAQLVFWTKIHHLLLTVYVE